MDSNKEQNPEGPADAGPGYSSSHTNLDGVARQSSEVSLASLVSAVRRRAVPMAVVFGSVFILGVAITFLLPVRYTASADVLFDPQNQETLDLGQLMGQQAGVPTISIENQVQIVTSRSFIGKVVDKLNLTVDPEFGGHAKSHGFGLISSVKRLFGVVPAPDASAADKARIGVINGVLSNMKVDVKFGTSVITIGFSSKDPAEAANIANTIADSYIVDQLEAKFDATRVANVWLSERLADLRQRVTDAERQVADYAAANNLQVLNEAGQTIQDQRVAQINNDLLQARSNLAQKQTRYEGLRAVLARGGNTEATAELMASPVFQSLRTQKVALLQRQSQLSSNLGSRHPEMIKLSEEIAGIDQQINAETQRILSALQNEIAVARSQVGVLDGGLRGAQGQTATASQASVHLHELRRNADSAKSLYETFLKRFNELGQQETLRTTNARVISRAMAPSSPSFPKRYLFLAVSLAIALLVAAIVAFILEKFDRVLRSRQEVESALGLPMLASLPLLGTGDDVPFDKYQDISEVVVSKPLSAFNEGFRLLRAGIQLSNVDRPPVVVLVTSSLPNEGKSTTALSLARSASMAGDRVLVIDGDLRRPGIAKMLGMVDEERKGLVHCLTEGVPIHDVVVKDNKSSLHILLSGTTVTNPPDLLSSAAFKNLIAASRQLYDLVVIDSAPVLPVIDSRLLGQLADTVVFCVRWEQTAKDAAQEAVRMLEDFNVAIAGVALTMTDRRRQARYGYYGDSYHYYGHYKNYYAS